MAKLPPINEIIRTIGGGNPTRRELLRDTAERVLPEMDDPEHAMGVAGEFFKQHPDLWKKEWGDLEDSMPEDRVDALRRVLNELRKT